MLLAHLLRENYRVFNLHVILFFITLLMLSPVQATLITPIFINEIHYDNVGGDINEFIELAGEAGTELRGWSLYAYNGSNGQFYNSYTFATSLVFTNQSNNFGFISVAFSGLQNGSPGGDAIALINPTGDTVQFISYEGEVTATNGPSDTQQSINIGVYEPSNTPLGFSLQLQGNGSNVSDFSWQQALQNTRNHLNVNQHFVTTNSSSAITVSEPKSLTIVIFALLLMLLNFRFHALQRCY